MEQMKARIEAVCDGYKSGLTVRELATGHNLSAYQVRHIISEHRREVN